LLAKSTPAQLIEQITEVFSSTFNWNIMNPVDLPEINHLHANEISLNFVHKLLVNAKKSAGSDRLSPRMLGIFADYIAGPVCAIYNRSITTCVYPTIWKLADTCPVPKCSQPTLDKLRPIANLPILGENFGKNSSHCKL
jgi:hypothetical protein